MGFVCDFLYRISRSFRRRMRTNGIIFIMSREYTWPAFVTTLDMRLHFSKYWFLGREPRFLIIPRDFKGILKLIRVHTRPTQDLVDNTGGRMYLDKSIIRTQTRELFRSKPTWLYVL